LRILLGLNGLCVPTTFFQKAPMRYRSSAHDTWHDMRRPRNPPRPGSILARQRCLRSLNTGWRHLSMVMSMQRHLRMVILRQRHLSMVITRQRHLSMVMSRQRHLSMAMPRQRHLSTVMPRQRHLSMVMPWLRHLSMYGHAVVAPSQCAWTRRGYD